MKKMIADTQYDYIIVVANSASRMLVSLLTEGIEHKELVLEADGSDEGAEASTRYRCLS
jgi:hypothetical protein